MKGSWPSTDTVVPAQPEKLCAPMLPPGAAPIANVAAPVLIPSNLFMNAVKLLGVNPWLPKLPPGDAGSLPLSSQVTVTCAELKKQPFVPSGVLVVIVLVGGIVSIPILTHCAASAFPALSLAE